MTHSTKSEKTKVTIRAYVTKIEKTCDCANEIKSVCAEVSVRCNISTEASRITVQTVCKGLYNHKYFLNKDEAIEKDDTMADSLAEYKQAAEPKLNRQMRSDVKQPTPVTTM